LAQAKYPGAIVALCANLTESTQMHFSNKKFPERFDQISVAGKISRIGYDGMAMGEIPFVSSYAMFNRVAIGTDQNDDYSNNNRPVVIVGNIQVSRSVLTAVRIKRRGYCPDARTASYEALYRPVLTRSSKEGDACAG